MSETLSNLITDVQLAEQRFIRGEADLAALSPYDRALLAHVEHLPMWDRPSSPVISRARSREADRLNRPAKFRKSYIPNAPDYDSPLGRR